MFEKGLMDRKKEMIRELTNSAWSILDEYYQEIEKNNLPEESAKEIAINRIKHIRYGDEGKDYFWITNMNPDMIMHPYRADLNGKDISDYTDPQGTKLFAEAVNGMTYAAKKVLVNCDLGVDSVTWVVAHQANYRIIKRVAKALCIDESRLLLSLEKYGNTGAASIPLTYHLGVQEQKFKADDIILFVSFGGGLNYGASIYRF